MDHAPAASSPKLRRKVFRRTAKDLMSPDLERTHSLDCGLLLPLVFLHPGASLDLGHCAPVLLAASFGGSPWARRRGT